MRAILLGIAVSAVIRAQAIPPCPPPGVGLTRTQYCALVGVVDGRLTILPGDRFAMSPAFAKGLARGVTLANAKEAVRKIVAEKLLALPKIYLSGLATGETDAALTDAATDGLRKFNGSWAKYAIEYLEWQNKNAGRMDPGAVFGACLSPLLQQEDSSAILNDDPGIDPAIGYISFSILDPFASNSVQIRLPGMAEARKSRRQAEIKKHLRGLDGKLWSKASILHALGPLYQNLGLDPQITVTSRDETISITEGTQFSSIVFSNEVQTGDIDSVLWNVLATEEFRKAMANREEWVGDRTLRYKDLGYATGDEPYVNQYNLQIEQLLLAQQGCSMTLQPSKQQGVNQYVDMRIQKASAKPKATSVEDSKTRPDTGIVDPMEPANRNQQQVKDRPRRVGLQLTFKPGQGISATGLFQISRVKWPLPNGALSLKGGGPSGNLISGNYFADFLNFSKFRQRVAMRLNGSQVVTRQRILAGRKVDQTDTGGLGHLEWQPFRNWNGADLRFWFDGSRTTVKLASNTASLSKQNLTAADFGATYYLRSVESEYPQQTVILPHVKMGLGISATERPFAHTTIVVRHQRSFDSFKYDFAGRFESATRSTPIFEQPSFGGVDVVRGFRADDGIGRQLWSVQSELLHPLPGLGAMSVRNTRLRQIVSGLQLAWFYDVGGVYQTTSSAPGARSGAGTGVHLDMKLAVLKFDWAYGFGEAASRGPKGKFYFGIQLNIPE